ncbi:hypothetical protein J1614_000180 [Plenodomus biglobosus]|nr:hypothetical protein J1614_000180 [Plenodomus biglobosus]
MAKAITTALPLQATTPAPNRCLNANMRSHQRHRVIDLTTEPDKQDEEATLVPLPRIRRQPDATRVPLPATTSKPGTTVTTLRSHRTPDVRRHHYQRDASYPAETVLDRTHTNGGIPPGSTMGSPGLVGATSFDRSDVLVANHGPAVNRANNEDVDFESSGRAAKRMRFSMAENHSPPRSPPSRGTITSTSGRAAATPPYTLGRAAGYAFRSQQPTEPDGVIQSGILSTNNRNKMPSVRDINHALKNNSTSLPLLDQVTTNTARAFPIGRLPQATGSTGWADPGPSVVRDAHSRHNLQLHGKVQFHQNLKAASPQLTTPIITSEGFGAQSNPTTPALLQPVMPDSLSRSKQTQLADGNGVISEAHSTRELQSLETPRLSENGNAASRPLGTSLPTAMPANPSPHSTPKRTKFTNQFTQEQDHYLIFLKEVKAYQWKMVTAEFNAIFPSRAYHTLQSRYSTVLNKRDRSRDPATLSLPPQFASEAAVDWATVHAANPGPRGLTEVQVIYTIAPPAKSMVQRHLPREDSAPQGFPVRQGQDHDYSSGGDSAPRRERSSRAARVNYTWPRQRRRGDDTEPDDALSEDVVLLDYQNEDAAIPAEDRQALSEAAVVLNTESSNVDFEAADASLALSMANRTLRPSLKNLPYLSVAQVAALQNIPLELAQDSQYRQFLQRYAWHIDFSPSEVDVVERSILKVKGSSMKSRHSTRRRHLRELLKGCTEATSLKLLHELRRTLRTRDDKSIKAFLQDAKAGLIADTPRIHRLAASRSDDRWSTRQSTSSASIIRERELGRQSVRGWRAASKSLTYQLRNKVMDTFGTATSWTGASGDIHAVAWASNGEMFAAAAVAVDDPHSMQYNRPNNLLFGKCTSNTLHELGEHYREREMTEQGPNSTHAMFASQDPKIYNTVSSLGFSKSGNLLYSAGYDGSICVWHTDREDPQPILGAKLNVKAPVDMITINPMHKGVLAAAVKKANSKAVRLLRINEEDPNQFERHNLHSTKAVSRPELKILPTAIQFEPRFGNVLLAGFGANIHDSGFDTTGDVCLWDVETAQPQNVYGASLNVFDVEFNPIRSFMPLFAVGCVAGSNVNRGTRSVVRMYDERTDNRYGCVTEIECKALDINDVVWCPHDEYLVAAGCTDGQSYIWDVRYEMDPLHVLSHGKSVMPLQDGIKHEYTDTGVRFLSWGDNATRLYSGSSDGVVKVWDVTRSKEDTFVKDIINTDSGIMAGAFSPDRSKLVVGEVNGSVHVLEVGRDDCCPTDTAKLRYIPYDDSDDKYPDDPHFDTAPESGIAEGRHLISTGQLQAMPMGSLPIRQVVQGPAYIGPYYQGIDAPMLREQVLRFQQSMVTTPGPQCTLTACKDSINKTTHEEVGDSGRSLDRIPDSLRSAWTASELKCIIPGKSKCTRCGRPARPSWDNATEDTTILCERCCFACFRCGAANTVIPGATSFSCHSCAATWDSGALGYDLMQQPRSDMAVKSALNVPPLKAFGRAAFLDRLEDGETSFGDDVNALTDYYFSLALDRPESPPL